MVKRTKLGFDEHISSSLFHRVNFHTHDERRYFNLLVKTQFCALYHWAVAVYEN